MRAQCATLTAAASRRAAASISSPHRPVGRRPGKSVSASRTRAFGDDLGADDILSAMESFHEEDMSVSMSEKAAAREGGASFKGTMDEDVFERVDEQKTKRRQKRSAVRAARETARAMGDRTKGSGSKLAFLYETSTDLDSADTLTRCNDTLRWCSSMEEVLKLVKEMRDAGVEPVESTYAAVMLVCQRIGSPERAVQVYDAMKEAQVSISSRTCQLAIECSIKAEQYKDALRIKDDMRYLGMTMSPTLYVTLLRALSNNDVGKRNKPKDRLIRTCRLFEEMLNQDIDPPPAAYHILIVAAARANQHDLAAKTFEEFVDTGVTPTRMTFETALDSMAKSGMISQALDTFLSMKKSGLAPRKASYNALLSACANAPRPRIREAFEIFEEMQADETITPDRSTYSLLIDTACKAGKPEMAFEAFSKMRDSDVEVQVGTLNRLIHATGLNAKEDETSVDAVLELYEAMKRLGVKPDAITYGSLISTCAKARKASVAIHLYEEMLKEGVEPNRILFNVLINALGRSDRRDEAMKYFDIMQSQAETNKSLMPNRETYTAIFNALIGPSGAELAIAKHALDSGDGVSFVHSAQVTQLRDLYARAVADGVYEDLTTSLAKREPDSGACTINMNMLSRTEATVASLVLLERLSTLAEANVPPATFIYAGKAKAGKSGASRRLLAIGAVLRAGDLKFEIGEVGAANLIAVKGKHLRKWVEKNAGTFA